MWATGSYPRPPENAAGIIFLRSAPAENARSPAPVRMATQAESSSRNRTQAATSASWVSGSIAFIASGRVIVMVNTRSFCS